MGGRKGAVLSLLLKSSMKWSQSHARERQQGSTPGGLMGGRFRGLCLMTGLKVVMVTSEASAETSISNQALGGMSWGGSDWALRGGTPHERSSTPILTPDPDPTCRYPTWELCLWKEVWLGSPS